jgi:hypothetical protein
MIYIAHLSEEEIPDQQTLMIIRNALFEVEIQNCFEMYRSYNMLINLQHLTIVQMAYIILYEVSGYKSVTEITELADRRWGTQNKQSWSTQLGRHIGRESKPIIVKRGQGKNITYAATNGDVYESYHSGLTVGVKKEK